MNGAGSLKRPGMFEEPGQEGWADFSARPHQRACQDPLTCKGGDALTKVAHYFPCVMMCSHCIGYNMPS